jgi:hypothetical protein
MLKKSASREGRGQVPFLLAEQRTGWSLMIFLCSRNARPQKALVGRAQWKTNQFPILEEIASKLGGSMYIVRCAQ